MLVEVVERSSRRFHILKGSMSNYGFSQRTDPYFSDFSQRAKSWISKDDGDSPLILGGCAIGKICHETIAQMIAEELVGDRLGLLSSDRWSRLHRKLQGQEKREGKGTV